MCGASTGSRASPRDPKPRTLKARACAQRQMTLLRILDWEKTKQSSHAKHKAIPLNPMNLFPQKLEHVPPPRPQDAEQRTTWRWGQCEGSTLPLVLILDCL